MQVWTDRFLLWMFWERERIVALDRGDKEAYTAHTALAKDYAKQMHFKFPRTRGGRAYG